MASLYQKWRSRSFDDLIGQEHVVRTLRNAVRQRRIAHAYLFTGPRGTGKTSTARILAKAVNCLNPQDGNPCNACEMCRAANEGRAVDVIEIDAASNTSVENVRDLRERVAYAAGEGRFKVYIVDEVHRLSAAAFDAFLKTLEEPPPHVIFVFASTEPHKVPETITSRCQRFDFRRIGPGETHARLCYVAEQEEIDVSDDALRLISQYAYGSLRDALGLLDQVASYAEGAITDADVRSALGLADAGLVDRLTGCLLQGEIGDGLLELHRFVDAGGDPRQLTRQFVDYWRALLLQVAGSGYAHTLVDPALAARLTEHASGLRESQVLSVLRAMLEQEYSAKFNVPALLPFEVGYVQASLALRAAPASSSASPFVSDRPASTSQAAPSVPRSTAWTKQTSEVVGAVDHANAEKADGQSVPRPAADSRNLTPPGREPTTGERNSGHGPVPAPSGIESAWPRIVANMRSKSPSLQAILRSGHVLRAEDGQITIGFLHDFHRNQFSDTKKRKLLEEVVEDVLGASYRVTCVRTTKEEVEAVRGADAFEEDDGFVEEATERLRAYHARELGNGDSW